MNTMKPLLSEHSILICVLWLLACCTGAACKDYRRTMWVSTTGEDSPQCILDSPAGDPVHYTLQPCRSLNYALKNIRSETVIGIACGIHVLEPVGSLSHGTPMVNLTIMGDCANDLPHIKCTNGANLAFYNISRIDIEIVLFQGCGEQLQHSARDSVPDSSTLYFQNCKTILIHHVIIDITGPYGRGIAFIRHDTSITHGDVLIEYVSIFHSGIHGSGLHFEILTGKTRDASPASERVHFDSIGIYNTRAYPECDPTMAFTGVNITVGGGGGGGVISLHSVSIVKKTTRGSGISLALLGRVNGFRAYLKYCQIIEGWENNQRKNSTAESCKTYEHPSSSTESDECTVYHSTSINIEVRENSTRNFKAIDSTLVKEHTPVSGNSLSIKVADQSKENGIRLKEVQLLRLNSSDANRRGLQIIVTGWARRNEIQVSGLTSLWHKAYWGGGGYVEFSEHATGNSVTLTRSLVLYNCALRGGGIAVVCRDFANQNTFQFQGIIIKNSFAEMGGGVYIMFQDSAANNTIEHFIVQLVNNTAHCGGGMFIRFQGTSVGSTVKFLGSDFMKNTLLPSKTYDMMGGGVHVDFSTVNASSRTDNTVNFTRGSIFLNSAGQGVGGGISVLYKHSHYHGNSGDGVIMDHLLLFHNAASSGSACSFQSYPTHRKKMFRGIKIGTVIARWFPDFHKMDKATLHSTVFSNKLQDILSYISSTNKKSMETISEQCLQAIFPSFQAKTNTNLILAKSVQVVVTRILGILCITSSQGLYALDSEIVLEADAHTGFQFCVATHGGAIALYGESYIRVGKNAFLVFHANHAFQRGGAIYVSSAPGVVPASDCFLQYDQGEENRGVFIFDGNTAKAEGQSVYVSDIRNCFSGRTPKNITTHLVYNPWAYENMYISSSTFVRQMNFIFRFNRTLYDTYYRHHLPLNISQLTSREYRLQVMKREIVFGPHHVSGTPVDWSKPLTLCFTPGKQKRLPYTVAYDELGSTISSVFTVLINKVDDSMPVELDSFSKFTDDFTVILHGIPQQHGMAYQSFKFPRGTGNRSAVVRPPQLVLQSLDNKDLLLVMNIELQCCPPGYIFRYGSGDKGTCHCGMTTVTGIIDCNENHPEMISAVLERNHWAGYLTSNDLHSCAGHKFFTALCPPGYCHTQKIILHENYSHQDLQDVVCGESSRTGLLCGDCSEGKGIAVNFNGIRPVCVSCEEGLSTVGILVWILSEWVPMLIFMFVLMLFNIDLVSGRFNSFLLFAQLLAFSTIRSDVELGPVHNAFVKIYRFLYGMWNLDFFGVLLPPYCLTPHAHFTLLQMLFLHFSIGLFPLTVVITLVVLERSAEKWICCHRVDQCLRRMRRWKTKYSDRMSYDRALPVFVILGFTRFLVSSFYILVNQTITGDDGERKMVVWWQGSVPYGSIQHIAYFIPAIIILLVFVLLPSFLLLTLPITPQLFGRLIIAVPPLRKLQKMQTFCSNVYTDRWVYHFVNVFQGCYKERFRSFSSLYLFHRIVHLLVAVFIHKLEDVLRTQLILTVALLLLIATCQPYNSRKLNTLDTAILGNLALILILNLHITDLNTPIGTRLFYASIQMILIYLALLHPVILLGKKVYLKCRQLKYCQKQEDEDQREGYAEPLLEAPAERLGNLVLITELHAGVPTSELEDDETVTETETET